LKIRIEDHADAFAVAIEGDDGGEQYYYFNQEDDRKELVDLFRSLGFDAYYEEVY
jgi:hypothetical protein